jgi:hypothetical protein
VTDITMGDVEYMAMLVNWSCHGPAERGWGGHEFNRATLGRDAVHPAYLYTFGDLLLAPPEWSGLEPITPGAGSLAMVVWREPVAVMGCWTREHLYRLYMGDYLYERAMSGPDITDDNRMEFYEACNRDRTRWLDRGLPRQFSPYLGPPQLVPVQSPPVRQPAIPAQLPLFA